MILDKYEGGRRENIQWNILACALVMSPVFESNADVWRAPRPPKTICPTISLCYFVGYGDFENRAVSREFWEFKRGNPSWIQAAAGEGEFKWLWPHLKRKRKKRKEKTKDEEE